MAGHFLSVVDRVLSVTREDVARALELQQVYSFLPPRDAVHVAVMLTAGIEQIVTADHHFDRGKEVKRVDPAEMHR